MARSAEIFMFLSLKLHVMAQTWPKLGVSEKILIKYRKIQVKYIQYRKIQENLLDECKIQEKQEYRSVWEVCNLSELGFEP